jgi:hypothetical protein
MIRPEVRVIETQYEETKPIEVSNWEKEQLLAKYGYINQTPYQEPVQQYDPSRDLSYQEMMEIEDRKYRLEQERRSQQVVNRPTTYTIDQDQVRYNEMRWSNMDLGGQEFGIQVQIVSDMKFTR